MAKKKQDIKQELDKKKKEGDDASQKALKLASLAEQAKTTLESMKGEATAEAAKSMETEVSRFQQVVEAQSLRAEQAAEEVNTDLENKQKKLDQGKDADTEDIKKLKTLQTEAQKSGVDVQGIAQAEAAKLEEAKFLDSESQSVEKSQQEMTKKIADAKQRRTAAKFAYKSRDTLGS
jgi:phage gp37-like protein